MKEAVINLHLEEVHMVTNQLPPIVLFVLSNLQIELRAPYRCQTTGGDSDQLECISHFKLACHFATPQRRNEDDADNDFPVAPLVGVAPWLSWSLGICMCFRVYLQYFIRI